MLLEAQDQEQMLPRLITQSLKRVLRDGGKVSATHEEVCIIQYIVNYFSQTMVVRAR